MSVRLILIRFFYTVLLSLLTPFLLLRLWLRSLKAPQYRERIAERFGFFNPPENPGGIWVHSVSLGESIAATPIIQQFKKQFPHIPITVTTTTLTGSNQIQKTFGDSVFHVYFPYDLPGSLHRFLQKVRPKLLLILETELWPNCLKICQDQKIPIVVANARLSPRSMEGYSKIKMLTQGMLACITKVCAQSQKDGDRYLQLGLKPSQLDVVGNIKFDVKNNYQKEDEVLKFKELFKSRSVWIAASTHKGEEEQVLDAFSIILKQIPTALLILVPRHPERFVTVSELVRERGFSVVTRKSGDICTPETQVFLGDTMGEMGLFYQISSVAFVGGSLVPIGGHNTLEPALCKVPAIVGPHTHNFVEITALLSESGALKKISNSDDLAKTVLHWLLVKEDCVKAGEAGLRIVEQNRGAVEKIIKTVESYL